MIRWPDWLPRRLHRKDPDFVRFARLPVGIVMHSGEAGCAVAEAALHNAGAVPGAKISYHFAWSKADGQIVQLVSCQSRAFHSGGVGNDALGVALSGPVGQNPRSESEREDFDRLLGELQDAFGGSLKWWCRHSDIAQKRDPGPGVDDSWFAAHGLIHDPRGPLHWAR